MNENENSRSCKRCKSKLVSGLKCVDCENYLHLSCAKLMNGVKIIDDSTVKCCAGLKTKDEIEMDYEALFEAADINGKIDMGLIKLFLKQKDSVIFELKSEVNILKEQLDVMNNLCKQFHINRSADLDHEITSDVKNPVKMNVKQVNPNVSFNRNEIVKAKFNVDNFNRPMHTEGSKSVDVLSDGQCKHTEKVKGGTSRNDQIIGNPSVPATYASVVSRNSSVIIGKKLSTLKAVNKLSWIFVSRFTCDVTKTDIEDYLKDSNTGIEQFDCVELTTKYNTYKSFKIGVPSNMISNVLNSDFWPEGILVKKFYVSRGNTGNDIASKDFLDRANV